MNANRPYPAIIILAFVALAILLMLWSMRGTNGPENASVPPKGQTTGSAATSPRDVPIPAPTAQRNDTASDSARSQPGPQNTNR
jgi:hypothetical protein